jgi:hypothetical protein
MSALRRFVAAFFHDTSAKSEMAAGYEIAFCVIGALAARFVMRQA